MNNEPEISNLRQTGTSIKASGRSFGLTQNNIKWLIRIFGPVALLLAGLGAYQWHHGHHEFFGSGAKADELQNWGNYGSYLQGTTASLWSLAAFCMVLVGFLGQMLQVYKQTEAYDQQAKQFQAEHDIQKRQNFESSFFQLLVLHNQIVSEIAEFDTSTNQPTYRGRACLDRWYYAFKNNPYRRGDDAGSDVPQPDSVTKYEMFYQEHQSDLGHYFRNLYHIIKFVRDSDVSDKRRYTSLVRATLSQSELALLFYNCLSGNGEERFKPLVQQFGLLKNLNLEKFLLSPADKGLYAPEAFK